MLARYFTSRITSEYLLRCLSTRMTEFLLPLSHVCHRPSGQSASYPHIPWARPVWNPASRLLQILTEATHTGEKGVKLAGIMNRLLGRAPPWSVGAARRRAPGSGPRTGRCAALACFQGLLWFSGSLSRQYAWSWYIHTAWAYAMWPV